MSASIAPTTGETRGPLATMRDYVALTKPAINRMCLLMAAGGMFLADGFVRGAAGAPAVDITHAILALIGTALAVASANALNMWLERDSDRLMRRTRDRPLAARRISPDGALIFGVSLGVVAVTLLALASNLATTLLGAGAIVSYVAIYTPLKYRHPTALIVGAIPGAVPPLMGWTAVTGGLEPAGLILFAVLFVWQMPHFIAISVVRRRDYDEAGIRTVPGVRGLTVARRQAIAWAALLLPVSVALCLTGVAGVIYAAIAGASGAGFLAVAVARPREANANRWAQRLFIASLIYLPVLVTGLALDVVV